MFLDTVNKLPNVWITWLSGEEFDEYAEMIVSCHDLLDGAFGFVNGLNLPVQVSADEDFENATYNGWLYGYYVSNIFVFALTGAIIYCTINAPESWHDAQIAWELYNKLHY
ncbi:hypothetical protein AX16_010815 [Volvariella volvacea WC 439]|nr:hypothetical protein AX16_010815 [Volvariella volvacea WC 439]